MADLVLYHATPTRSSTVLWLLEESGAEFELRPLNLQAGEQRDPEFLALNPMGKVPCLVDRGVPVSEVAAICLYVAERFPQSGLHVEVGDPLRGAFLKWLFFAPGCLEPAIMDRAMPRREEAPKTQIGYGSLRRTLGVISSAIEAGPYLLGDRFSAADVLIGSTLNWAMGFGMIDKEPVFERYVARLKERPAWQRAIARDQEILSARSTS